MINDNVFIHKTPKLAFIQRRNKKTNQLNDPDKHPPRYSRGERTFLIVSTVPFQFSRLTKHTIDTEWINIIIGIIDV